MTSSAVHGASSSSASSPPLTRSWDYHVFLSFRGEDIRDTFTAHLYGALNRGGINTYIDNELKRGEEISPALLKAIEGSRISIIVFSKNYAKSRWCMDELTKILECKKTKQQTIIPVFYHVDPADVRNQRNKFGDAFAKLEGRFKDEKEKVQIWKAALTEVANLAGRHLSNGNEAEFINKIVRDVSTIVDIKPLHVAEHPVGIKTRVEDIMKSHLRVEMKEVRIVGIVGVGGIGKSTIAREIYNSIAHEFQGSCFLEKVREESEKKGGLVPLQEKLLCDILGNSERFNVGSVAKGMNVIKDRLSYRRVLLILDDVDQLDHLEKLAGGRDWFGSGSRIIITTRDERVLTSYEVDSMYTMKGLYNMEALELFSWHAFKSDKPIADYGNLTDDIIRYAGGLPLALKVLGSDLKDRSLDEWKYALNELEKAPHDTIQKILRISFDGLGKNEKDIFLDIACFFKGKDKGYIGEMLDGCGFSSVIGIRKLVEKCLVTIDNQTVGMHDLVQDMGKELVRQESPTEPGGRSRLWFHDDILHVLEENTGTNKIEGIVLLSSPEDCFISLNPQAFEKMTNLRLFISTGVRFGGELKNLPNELRVLDWDNYPSHLLPSNFKGKKLKDFRMHNSFIKELRGGRFEMLTSMELSYCNKLREISDLSSCSNLKELDVSNCPNLAVVHQSVGSLDKLVTLKFDSCSKLQSFPKSLNLRSLEKLFIWFCKRLQQFPEIGCEMKNATVLSLRSTGIKKLPSSIANLSRLEHFYLWESKTKVLSLPRSIFQFKALQSFSLKDCPKVVLFEKDVGNTRQNAAPMMFSDSAKENQTLNIRTSSPTLNLGGSGLSHSDLSMILIDCSDHGFKQLFLQKTNIERLPSNMVRFVRLTLLDLDDCKQLREIPDLPPNIKEISARGCTSMKRFSQLPKILWQFNESGLRALEKIILTGCDKLLVDVPRTSMFQGYPTGYGRAFRAVFPGSTMPDSLRPCEKNSDVFEINIGALRNSNNNIRGIALYVVFGTTYGKSGIEVDYGRGPGFSCISYSIRDSMRSNHVLLLCISTIGVESVRVRRKNDSDLHVIKYCGFYPVQISSLEDVNDDANEELDFEV